MIAIAVDDESWALKTLTNAIRETKAFQDIFAFHSCNDTLEWASHNPFDVAFLDIDMRGIGGLELARRLRELFPNCCILFCTGYREYAYEAFQIHADGYLLKPVSAEQIQKELNAYTARTSSFSSLTVRCFGGFDVFDSKGRAIRFRRKKTKELLAILVDRRGMGITAKEICTLLWDDDAEQDKKNMQYLWNLFSDLTKTLKGANAENIVLRNGADYLIDADKIRCDYFDYIKGILQHADIWSYMSKYSWAENTIAYLSTIHHK